MLLDAVVRRKKMESRWRRRKWKLAMLRSLMSIRGAGCQSISFIWGLFDALIVFLASDENAASSLSAAITWQVL